MGSDLSRRLARVEGARQDDGAWVIVPTLPGLSNDEALRLQFGPDRTAWPAARSNVIFLENDPDLCCRFDKITTRVPYHFAKDRNSPLFVQHWRNACEDFDRDNQRRPA
ncbi:MAG: hypothetical protein ACRYGP_08255 [Janthinobacterium lividum]